MHSHQSYPNTTTVIHSYEYNHTIDNSTIETSRSRGLVFCSHWSLVDVSLKFFCPADHVPDWQPRILLGMVEARSVNVKKTTTFKKQLRFAIFVSEKHVCETDEQII